MTIESWNYNEDLLGKDNNSSTFMMLGLTHNRDTDKLTGVYFKWFYELKREEQILLYCEAKDNYRITDFENTAIIDIVLLLNNSLQNFLSLFQERLDLLDIEVAMPSYTVDEKQISLIVDELHRVYKSQNP